MFIINFIIMLIFILISVAFVTLLERKVFFLFMSDFQDMASF